MGSPASGAAGAPASGRRDRLEPGTPGQRIRSGEKGGSATVPNPTDRGKLGTKRDLVTEERGTPLVVNVSNHRLEGLTGANRRDRSQMSPTADVVPLPSTGRRDRLPQRPDKLHADEVYDSKAARHVCRARGIIPRIARKGNASSEKLGRHRWAEEGTHAWFNRFHRLAIRYERRLTTTKPSPASLPASLHSTRSIGSVKRPLIRICCASRAMRADSLASGACPGSLAPTRDDQFKQQFTGASGGQARAAATRRAAAACTCVDAS